ncbi:MAG: tRNA uridine-5-carboxymethylaminomethyl(34) synthesis GTPase MnmE [Bdellovibrionales bacterium]|nr:tRNA uridine-5-carboxymethylaminomethyl(34) synthesis GTPase MnmE [Bdellovibrionales bacterium]
MLNFRSQDKDTICALATPPGQGALALIRLSGDKAFAISKKCCPFLPKSSISHRIYFGTFLHPRKKETLDEVLVFCFEKGRSFTGEESVEISCHGSLYLSSLIIESLVEAGARLADRGEFSYRAFMNGKMDLVQAESVLNLIQSRSPRAHTQAIRGLKGKLSDRLKNLEKKLVKLLAHLEASIDFSDQEIEPFSEERQNQLLEEIRKEVKEALKGFHQGKIDREGFRILLLGAPNAGKSSLFNYLIQDDRAIVTRHPGTTRDILSARLLLNQREFSLKDTAGLRKNPDPVESQGIKKTLKEVAHSDLCLFLVESACPLKEERFFGLENLDPKKTVIVFSKSDQIPSSQREAFFKQVEMFFHKRQAISFFLCRTGINKKILWLSSRTGEGREDLKKLFYKRSEREAGEIFLSTPRQKQAMEKITYFLDKAKKLLKQKSSPEFITFELQQALSVLYQLLGKEYNEEVIKQVFKEFCIGK